jgi:sulfur carrier protein
VEVHVNGRPETITGAPDLQAWLLAKGIDPAHVVVELNREIIAREAFAGRTLQPGDRLEILRFVGGG